MNLEKTLCLHVNGKKQEVAIKHVKPTTTLNTFLREKLFLTGTKRMCLEGGCGVCIVTVVKRHPATGKMETLAVNSCLVPILSCSHWHVYTIEGIGTSRDIHPVQDVLEKFHGSQCGYCSPGMVMNAYSLKMSKERLRMKDIENSFGGNICRCTGYRPILSAFKSICYDANSDLVAAYPDIEDIKPCNTPCDKTALRKVPFYYSLNNHTWINVLDLNDLLQVIKTFKGQNNGINEAGSDYALVAGDTAKGVYKNKQAVRVYVDIANIQELKDVKINENCLIMGANVTLTEAMEVFEKMARTHEKYRHLDKMAKHIDLIANVPVRNTGTLAGNLMIKHQNIEFPSDIFIILETFKAKLLIVDINKMEYLKTPSDFLSMNMSDKIIHKIQVPCLDDSYKYETYKIMPRAQNAHAIVNAGFLLKLNNNGQICEANIVYGNINKRFVHAKKAELFLIGKFICQNQTLQQTFKILETELNCDHVLPEPEPKCRKILAISLFYKFILSITPENLLPKRMLSGRSLLERPISSGTQNFDTKTNLYPLTKPVTKKEASAQVTGEAEYIMDMPDIPNQHYAAFVLAKAPANSKIIEIITKKAMDLKGVLAFLDKNSIPGKNTYTPMDLMSFVKTEDELFCNGTVKFYHQPIGIVVATSHDLANQAADLIEVKYQFCDKKPLLTIKDILKDKANKGRVEIQMVTEAKDKGNDVKQVIHGTYDMFWQYHFHMETQCCNAIPKEGEIDLYPGSQWMDLSQNAAAAVLGIPASRVNVSVRRLGGGFGGKLLPSCIISTAAALAAHLLRVPVKIWLPLETNMSVTGKRHPVHSNYEVGLNKKGEIQYLNNDFYFDNGCARNAEIVMLAFETYLAVYDSDRWFTRGGYANSDTHANSYMRAPATEHGIGMVESILEHCAMTIGMDPLEYKIKNISKDQTEFLKLVMDFKKWADISTRKAEIKQFNKDNMWRKKGLSVTFMIFPMDLYFTYGVIVSIYHHDGSVSISHGGVEIGQGINTKAIQVCAYKLGISMEKVSVKPSTNLVAPNSAMTGGSVTSEGVCWAILKACDILLKRMEPVRLTMENPSWEELIHKCYEEFVDLCATSTYSPKDEQLKGYKVFGVCSSEVELDVLTGQYRITRVDLLEDTGQSMNPAIDIGQIEGAFVMGLGYYTTEQMVINENGEILTNRTWNYKPPGAKDIPVDFRIKFPENGDNPVGVLKSKAVGEPPLCLAVSIPLAIRQAVAAVREQFGVRPLWYPFDGPSSVEDTLTHCFVNYEHYTI